MYTPQYISDEKPKKFGKICTAQMYSPDGAIYNYRKHQNAPFYLSFLDFCTTRIYVTHSTEWHRKKWITTQPVDIIYVNCCLTMLSFW